MNKDTLRAVLATNVYFTFKGYICVEEEGVRTQMENHQVMANGPPAHGHVGIDKIKMHSCCHKLQPCVTSDTFQRVAASVASLGICLLIRRICECLDVGARSVAHEPEFYPQHRIT